MPRIKADTNNAVFESIRKMIRHYTLAPNQVISDMELAEKLGTSRTPVREAIYRLMDYGLVEKEGSKTIVKPIRLDDVHEIFQVRQAIECMATRLIVDRGGLTEAELAQLTDQQKNLENCINGKNFDDNFKLDAEFHQKLIACSQNSRLVDIQQRMTIQGERLRWLTSLTPERHAQTLQEHQQIIQSVMDKDASAAANAVETHIRHSVENYEYILDSGRWNKIIQTLGQMR